MNFNIQIFLNVKNENFRESITHLLQFLEMKQNVLRFSNDENEQFRLKLHNKVAICYFTQQILYLTKF